VVPTGDPELTGDGLDQARRLDGRHVEVDGTGLGAGRQQDLLDDLAELLRGVGDGVERRRPPGRLGPLDVLPQPFREALDDRERRLQLMAGGGHEQRLRRVERLLVADVVDGDDLALVEG